MIIRESVDFFTMTSQHDHAVFSGEIARHVHKPLFLDERWMEDTLLAIREHDRGWIGLDETPLWNDCCYAPFSFMDYPLLPKLPMYVKGLDEVEAMSGYAALLCSLHYTSFPGL